VVDDPDDYKVAGGIAIAWVDEGQSVRIGVDVVYDSEEEEEGLIEKDPNDVVPVAGEARRISLILIAHTSPQNCD